MGRVLKWDKLLEIKANATTKIADYQAKANGDWTIQFNQYACWDAPHEFYLHADGNTLDAAMDACESDYIARCSEFLRVAGPGECVVPLDMLDCAIDTIWHLSEMVYGRDEEGSVHVGQYLELLTDIVKEAKRNTAAIDAAGKETK